MYCGDQLPSFQGLVPPSLWPSAAAGKRRARPRLQWRVLGPTGFTSRLVISYLQSRRDRRINKTNLKQTSPR